MQTHRQHKHIRSIRVPKYKRKGSKTDAQTSKHKLHKQTETTWELLSWLLTCILCDYLLGCWVLIDIKILTLDIHPKIRVPIKQAQTIFLSSSAISIELFPTIINNNKKQNNKLTHDIRSRSIKHGMKMYPLVFLVLLFAQCLFPICGCHMWMPLLKLQWNLCTQIW